MKLYFPWSNKNVGSLDLSGFTLVAVYWFSIKAQAKEEEDTSGSQSKGLQKTDLYHLQKVRSLSFLSICIL